MVADTAISKVIKSGEIIFKEILIFRLHAKQTYLVVFYCLVLFLSDRRDFPDLLVCLCLLQEERFVRIDCSCFVLLRFLI